MPEKRYVKRKGKHTWPHKRGSIYEWSVIYCECPRCGAQPMVMCFNLHDRTKQIKNFRHLHEERIKEFKKLRRRKRYRKRKRKPGKRKSPKVARQKAKVQAELAARGGRKRKTYFPSASIRGNLYRTPLIREIVRQDGHIHKIAWQMTMSRSQVYRMIERWHLWPLVNQAREAALLGQPLPGDQHEAENTLDREKES